MDFDVLIVGAGPAGLAMANGLAGSGLRVALVEPQTSTQLSAPDYDGREIALTRHSVALLGAQDVWSRIAIEHRAPLHEALVFDGADTVPLQVRAASGDAQPLGWLASNHAIRRASWEALQASHAATVLDGCRVQDVRLDAARAEVVLNDGRRLCSRLLIAADSRHSQTRRAVGIGAHMRDFGRSMLVCRMRLEQPCPGQAWEWFDHDQTLALLPLHADQASVVLTLPQMQIAPLLEMPVTDFDAQMQLRFHGRVGAMHLTSTRHAYALVGVYARRFSTTRFALLGDAAVGMHPVTAHGFNLGLAGAAHLAALLRNAAARGADIGAATLLARYARAHHARCLPLYLATQGIVDLYTRERAPAHIARHALLRAAARVPGFRQGLGALLAGQISMRRDTAV